MIVWVVSQTVASVIGWFVCNRFESQCAGLNWCTVSVFGWRDWGKPPRCLDRIVGVTADIQSRHPLNASLQHYWHTSLLIFRSYYAAICKLLGKFTEHSRCLPSEWWIMQSITELIMIHEILSILFQVLNAMPTETKLQYTNRNKNLFRKQFSLIHTNCKETSTFKNKHCHLMEDLGVSQQCLLTFQSSWMSIISTIIYLLMFWSSLVHPF
jgi:hypothetical protein